MAGRELFFALVSCFFFFGSAPSQQRPGPPDAEARLPVHILGEVLLEDGAYPDEPVRVEMFCEGAVRRQTFAHQGRYTLKFGTKSPAKNALADASIDGNSRDGEFFQPQRLDGIVPSQSYSRAVANTLDLYGCDLRATLPGFESSRISLGRRKPLDRREVAPIVLRRVANVEGTTISLNSLQAPDKAKKAYRNAQKELRKTRPSLSKARRELERAVKEFPDFAAGWQLLGEVHLRRTDEPAAHQAFTESMTADPNYIRPYLSLASLEFDQERWGEVEKLCSRVIGLNPHVTYAHYLCGAANYSLRRMDLAEESIRKVKASNEANQYPVAHFILGGILTEKGDIASAAAEFQRFLEIQPEGALARQSKNILMEWEKQGVVGHRTVPKN